METPILLMGKERRNMECLPAAAHVLTPPLPLACLTRVSAARGSGITVPAS